MHYAILCYHSEEVVTAWTKEQNEEVMGRLEKVRQRIAKEGKLGPVARLLPTTAATTLRKDRDPPLIIDGPFAETKELLAGFWIWQVRSFDEAVEWLKRAPFDGGTEIELRPIFEMEDFGEALTPELREQEERLRAETAKRAG